LTRPPLPEEIRQAIRSVVTAYRDTWPAPKVAIQGGGPLRAAERSIYADRLSLVADLVLAFVLAAVSGLDADRLERQRAITVEEVERRHRELTLAIVTARDGDPEAD
jgi:hypothetical protein